MKNALTVTAALLLSVAAQAQATLYTHDGGSAAAQNGAGLALFPDLDGDGVSDYAVGAPFEDYYADGSRRGVVRVYSGKTDALLRTLVGPGHQSEFGHAIAATPDLTGDGRADLLIGAPSHSGALSKQGAAFLFNSSTGAQLGAYYGASANEYLGWAVANLGDTNGDGRDDWAVSAPFADVNGMTNSGRVRVYNGFNGSLLLDWNPGYSGMQSGWSLAGVGDVDGDGRHDFVVGSTGYTHSTFNLTNAGALQLVRGYGATAWWTFGSESFEQLGWCVAAVGDLTGDGSSEVAVGTPYYDGGGASRGRVRVLNGATGAVLFEVTGSIDAQKIGASVAAAGDWNGDGVRDIAVGAPGVQLVPVGVRGQVRIHSGVDGAFLTALWGSQTDSDWARSLAGGRDLNADGRVDLLIGAPAEDGVGANSGVARLVLSRVASPSRYGASKSNSYGCSPRIEFTGAPSRSLGNNFHITAKNIVPNKAGMLFWGFTQVTTPFGGGTLLVGQPIVRTPLQNSGGTGAFGACDGSFDFHFSQALMQQHGLLAGERLYAQYWHRDPGFAFPNNIGLTDALRFDIAN